MKQYTKITKFAAAMRRKIIDISFTCGSSTHIGGALSMTDLMAVLYSHTMNFDPSNPAWDKRDRFILSKGHGVLGFFPALLLAGFITEEKFATFQTNGSDLIAHPVMNLKIGIESSSGSLGHGISMAVGIALAAKKLGKKYHTYTLIGDGEANEGSVWEAVMLASHHKLDNLTVIVDYNKLQNDGGTTEIVSIPNMSERFNSFGWQAIDIDGHDIGAIVDAFERPTILKPKVIVARTIKGKGVKFMENNNTWHHNRLTISNYEEAVTSLNSIT